MPNTISTEAAPTFALSIGTKKAPAAFLAPRAGVALAAGKAGTEARKAEKASLPQQARNGTYGAFAGYLAATFPKALKDMEARVAAARKLYESEVQTAKGEELELFKRKLESLSCARVTNRAGFDTLVQCILSWANTETKGAKPKQSKAQADAMALVLEYVNLSAAPAAPAAPAQAEPAVH